MITEGQRRQYKLKGYDVVFEKNDHVFAVKSAEIENWSDSKFKAFEQTSGLKIGRCCDGVHLCVCDMDKWKWIVRLSDLEEIIAKVICVVCICGLILSFSLLFSFMLGIKISQVVTLGCTALFSIILMLCVLRIVISLILEKKRDSYQQYIRSLGFPENKFRV